MSLPTANVPSWSIVVFGADPGDAAGDGDGPGEAVGPGGGVGSGSAPATPADAAQPATSNPAAAHRADTDAFTLNPMNQQLTGAGNSFHIKVDRVRDGRLVAGPVA